MGVTLFLVSVSLLVAVVPGEKSVSRTAYTHQEEMKVEARTDGFVAETENVL